MTDIWLLAIGVFELVVSVRVDVCEFASLIFTGVGLKAADVPVGRPVAVRLTAPVNEANGVVVTVY